MATSHALAATGQNPLLERLGFSVDTNGKPIIPLESDRLYAFGQFIRAVENKILDLFGKGLLSGTTHTCLGQEFCQMSVVRALNHADDVILSNHRNHGHFLTYTADALGLIAEIMGREAGVCGGYGGSQHLAYRNFHSNGVQAGMTAIGVGHAKALAMSNSDGIVAIVIGDGTLGEGLLYEAMNLASIWQLPVLFVVEHNKIAQTTYTDQVIGGTIEARGSAFGLDTWLADDSDEAFFSTVEDVADSVRSNKRPGLLVISTERLGPHSKGDDLRSPTEKEAIAERDPLTQLARQIDPLARQEIDDTIDTLIAEVEELALASASAKFEKPAVSPALDQQIHSAGQRVSENNQNVRATLNSSLEQLLADDEKVLLIGEDLHDPYGGAFKVTADLSSRYSNRVLSTPISEAAITGASIGLAMSGFKPIVEIMFADFMTLCMDQLFNHAIKFPDMFQECQVPLIMRTPCGGRRGYGPTHSQSIENLFVGMPGLTVVFPSQRHDGGRMLRDIVASWPSPVLFLEHKLLYGESCDRAEYNVLEPGQNPAESLFPVVAGGSQDPDLTIVTYGGMVKDAEKAAQHLTDEEELQIEVVIPSLISPIQDHLVAHLSLRTNILIAEEAHSANGFGAELAARLAEVGCTPRIARVGTPPIAIPAARSMENEVIPDHRSIIKAAIELIC